MQPKIHGALLPESYILYFLRPDYNNFSKRPVKSPKLYFYDTGLACSLLEIKNVTQIRSHYLRGGLFENMVINEFHKRAYNRGIEPSLSFWHNSSGYEVDLIQTEAEKQYGYEIKSGATFSKEFFKGLNYWSKLSGAGPQQKNPFLNHQITLLLWCMRKTSFTNNLSNGRI